MRGEDGFTLVEVLVALVVTALLLGILMNGATMARGRMNAAAERTEAVALASALLDQASIGDAAGPATTSGRTGKFSWTIERVQIATEPRHLVGLFAWRVSIFGRDHRRLISVPTRRLISLPQS